MIPAGSHAVITVTASLPVESFQRLRCPPRPPITGDFFGGVPLRDAGCARHTDTVSHVIVATLPAGGTPLENVAYALATHATAVHGDWAGGRLQRAQSRGGGGEAERVAPGEHWAFLWPPASPIADPVTTRAIAALSCIGDGVCGDLTSPAFVSRVVIGADPTIARITSLPLPPSYVAMQLALRASGARLAPTPPRRGDKRCARARQRVVAARAGVRDEIRLWLAMFACVLYLCYIFVLYLCYIC